MRPPEFHEALVQAVMRGIGERARVDAHEGVAQWWWRRAVDGALIPLQQSEVWRLARRGVRNAGLTATTPEIQAALAAAQARTALLSYEEWLHRPAA
jgi:hypothetical protein